MTKRVSMRILWLLGQRFYDIYFIYYFLLWHFSTTEFDIQDNLNYVDLRSPQKVLTY